MSVYYSSPAQVRSYTGARASALGLANNTELDELLEGWLVQIKSLIDIDRNRDFLVEASGNPDAVPPLVHNVAMRAAANMYGFSQLRRETPVIRVDDYNVRVVPDAVLTEDLKKDLRRIRSKPIFRMYRVGDDFGLTQPGDVFEKVDDYGGGYE